MAPAKV